MRYKCDCCEWQEDYVQRKYPDFTGGAKENYKMFGVFDKEYIINCLSNLHSYMGLEFEVNYKQ